MTERTCGNCKHGLLPIGDPKTSERRLCCLPLPMLVTPLVYLHQRFTKRTTNASECKCYKEREETND
jgi:hypothetical protein